MINLKQYEKGEIIIRENEVGEVAYIIQNGSVEISREINNKKIILATMSDGQIFGEMGMLDESPRSATVTAIENTLLREIHRDDFFETFKSNPVEVLPVLKSIFERLRDANVKILQLTAEKQEIKNSAPLVESMNEEAREVKDEEVEPIQTFCLSKKILPDLAYIEGLTKEANEALPQTPYPIMDFPFLIGRKSDDPFANNDLTIIDTPPFNISRHHIKIIFENGKLGAIDRCSSLGSFVNGKHIGGKSLPGPIFFDGPEGIITLGTKKSLFKYRVYLKN